MADGGMVVWWYIVGQVEPRFRQARIVARVTVLELAAKVNGAGVHAIHKGKENRRKSRGRPGRCTGKLPAATLA